MTTNFVPLIIARDKTIFSCKNEDRVHAYPHLAVQRCLGAGALTQSGNSGFTTPGGSNSYFEQVISKQGWYGCEADPRKRGEALRHACHEFTRLRISCCFAIIALQPRCHTVLGTVNDDRLMICNRKSWQQNIRKPSVHAKCSNHQKKKNRSPETLMMSITPTPTSTCILCS